MNPAENYVLGLDKTTIPQAEAFGNWYALFFRGHPVRLDSLYEAWEYARRSR